MNGSSHTAASPTPASAEQSAAVPAVAVACSGGPDSMALLWLVWRCASRLGVRTLAFHVHHGLQSAAQAWPAFIEQECERWVRIHPESPVVGVHVRHLKGRPSKGESLEAWAREGRYRALRELAAEQGVDLLVLGHHRQDQAETFLLQALRGAGPQGLAGMPRLQWRDGVCWARPFLNHGRETVQQVLKQAQVRSVEDPSNQDTRLARNALRQAVWPALMQAFPNAEQALALAAQRCAQALETIGQGVEADWVRCVLHEGDNGRCWQLDLPAWRAMSPSRRSQLLRAWFQKTRVKISSATLDQLAGCAFEEGRAQRWPLDERHELRWYRSQLCITLIASSAAVGAAVEGSAERTPVQWRALRAGAKRFPAWAGRLVLKRAGAGEVGAALNLPAVLVIRAREGDDQFQLSPRGTARSLKKQFQARAVPAWDRIGPVVADEQGAVLWVPGLGWNARVAQVAGGWCLAWHPD